MIFWSLGAALGINFVVKSRDLKLAVTARKFREQSLFLVRLLASSTQLHISGTFKRREYKFSSNEAIVEYMKLIWIRIAKWGAKFDITISDMSVIQTVDLIPSVHSDIHLLPMWYYCREQLLPIVFSCTCISTHNSWKKKNKQEKKKNKRKIPLRTSLGMKWEDNEMGRQDVKARKDRWPST